MKKVFYIVYLFLSFVGITGVTAQHLNLERSTIFDALAETAPGKGEVVVNQSPAIANMVGSRLYGTNIERAENATYMKVQEYRVQVFSGNNPRSSKDEAFNKEKEVKARFPNVPTYVTYNAPFWRLRVGDYGTYEQAHQMLRQLREAFPSFGKEMYPVKEEVRIPVHSWDY